MAKIIPFRGILYSPEVVGDIRDVVAPPYDVIDAEYQQALHTRHPYNVIRLELGHDLPDDGPTENRYSRASGYLREWLANGTLRRDTLPAIYPYTVEYHAPFAGSNPARQVLKGFLSTIELEEFGSGRIFPHENTRSSAKTDRFKLLESCRAHFSPIFSLFSDPGGGILHLIQKSIDADTPRIEARDDSGFCHRLWALTDTRILKEVISAMRPIPLFIADGHHRYETALNYRRLRNQQTSRQAPSRPQPHDSVLMLFSSLEDPGLTVLPTHRVLKSPLATTSDLPDLLNAAFAIQEFRFSSTSEAEVRQRFIQALRTQGESATVFGLARRGSHAYLLLVLRSTHSPTPAHTQRDRLDVSILQHQIVNKLCPSQADQERVYYTKDDDEALDLVGRGEAEAALLLNPTKLSEIRAVAEANERMPHKSTYFFPKPLTGLVMNVMDP